MNVAVVILGLCYLVHTAQCAMTEAQIKATGKLVRRTCKTKTKAQDGELDAMLGGNWDGISREAMCYLNCCLQMMKLVQKDGHLDMISLTTQLATLPETRREPTNRTLHQCKDEGSDLTDKCEIAYEFCKCVYFDNPGNYLLP